MKITFRNIAAFVLAKIKIAGGKPNKVIEQCKKGECILSIYTHKMDQRQLSKIIDWLKEKGISFISLPELNRVLIQKNVTLKGKAILTIDDGWLENQQLMTMAEKKQIPICIFLTTGPIEQGGGFWWTYIKKAKKMGLQIQNVEWHKRLTNDERGKTISKLKSLINIKREALKPSMIISHKHSEWICFGAHTMNHPILTRCNEAVMKNEILQSADKIQAWIGNKVNYFTYPNGNYTDREKNVLKENGFQMAFTTYPTQIHTASTDPFSIPRCEILERASLAENICRITGTWLK